MVTEDVITCVFAVAEVVEELPRRRRCPKRSFVVVVFVAISIVCRAGAAILITTKFTSIAIIIIDVTSICIELGIVISIRLIILSPISGI